MSRFIKALMIGAFLVVFLAHFGTVRADVCGNSTCESGENQCTCPSDCGTCSGDAPSQYGACKTFTCAGPSDSQVCSVASKTNCCGNNSCETGENYGNCDVDCIPTSLDIHILNPANKEKLVNGEHVKVEAEVNANGRIIAGAAVNAFGFFKSIELFDDGKHDDEKAEDGIYANAFTVPGDLAESDFNISVNGSFKGAKGNSKITIVHSAILDATIDPISPIVIGDIIQISGTIFAKTIPRQIPLDLNIYYGKKQIDTAVISSDGAGVFSATYHTSSFDPHGQWTVTIEGKDENNNTARAEAIAEVNALHVQQGLKFKLLNDLNESYSRGDSFLIAFGLSDNDGNAIPEAELVLSTPLNESIPLHEFTTGKYSVLYTIPYSFPTDVSTLTIRGNKSTIQGPLDGEFNFFIRVNKIDFSTELVEKLNPVYQIGETIPLKVELKYPNGDNVTEAEVHAFINKSQVQLQNQGFGIFSGSYTLGQGDEGKISIAIEAKDPPQNTSIFRQTVNVGGTSILYELSKNSAAIALGILAVLIVGGIVHLKFRSKIQKSGMDRRMKQIEDAIQELENNYYNEGKMKREEFSQMREKYETELDAIIQKKGEKK